MRHSQHPPRHRSHGIRLTVLAWMLGLVSLMGLSSSASAAPAGVILSNPAINLGDLYILDTDPTHDGLLINLALVVNRNQPLGGPRNIPIRITARLLENDLPPQEIAVVGSTSVVQIVTVPAVAVNMPVSINLKITPGKVLTQLHTHLLNLSVSHDDDPPSGTFQSDFSATVNNLAIVHFTGPLSFGAIGTTLLQFSLPPFAIPAPSGWRLWISQGQLANGTPYANQVPSTTVVDVTRNDKTGTASALFGSVLVMAPGAVIDTNGWTGTVGPILLDNNGLRAQNFSLNLPEGSGWRLDDINPGTTALLNPVFSSEGTPLPLNENLQPIGPVTGAFNQPREFVDERMALGFIGNAWSWNLQTLDLIGPSVRFQRAYHYDQWQSVKGDLPDANDGYLDQLTANVTGNLSMWPGLNQGGFDAGLTLSGGVFSTHFPHGFVAHAGGVIQLVRSTFNRATSSLPVATTTILTYTGCRPSDDPNALPDPMTLEAVQVGPGNLGFTEQGGLWTAGPPVPDPNPLDEIPIVQRAAAGLDETSGDPVHETADYIGRDVNIYVPGPSVPAADGLDRSDDTNTAVDESGEHPNEFNPARWLYTGVGLEDDFAMEHPATSDYLEGLADYAGVNFRHFPGLTGTSRIGGGLMGPYDLDPCQKLYARASGTSGRWVADNTTLPPTVQVGGPDPFDFTFQEWAFQLVGNEPQFEHSAVAGSVTLPHPADFSLAFDSLEFNCCGNLERVRLAEGESVKSLAYWQQARIAIQSARFVSAEECSMTNSCLELHVVARVNSLDQDVDGILCFRGSGRMTTGLDAPLEASALHLPVGTSFAGDYYVEPVRHAYYNDPPGNPVADIGFINVAGLVRLPFFDAMESHAHLTGTDLAPGINADLIPGLQGGWTDNNETYFSNANFDAAHRGFPPALASAIDYLLSQSESYLPRAERTWFGKVPFDFPVVYDPPTGFFHSLAKKNINVIIASADADVPYLNHERAAIDFGITVGLSLNNLLSDALAFVTGEITEGFADLAIGPALDALGVGFGELDGLLSLQARDALGEGVLPTLDSGIIAQAAQQIKSGSGVNTALNQINFNAALQTSLASGAAGFVTGKLGPIGNGLEGMRTFLAQGNESQLGQFMERALDFLNLPPGLDTLSVTDLIELGGVETGPVRERLEILRERMAELRDLVQNVTGLDGELEGLLTGANLQFSNLQLDVRNQLQDYFELVDADPGAYSLAEIEDRIRVEVEDRLWAMPVVAQVQTVLRSRFYHVDHLARQVLSSALDQLNRAITDIVSEAVDLDGLLTDLSGIGGYVQAVSLKGEAVITGNDLTYLSLKGHTTIQTEPIPLDFDPFYEYQQLHSEGATACDLGLVPFQFNRITMGATVAPARMPFGEVSITLSTQFSFTEDGRILGFQGGFEVLQEGLTMQPVNFDRISVLLNIGGNDPSFSDFEFYIVGEAQATLFKTASPIQLPWTNFKLHGGLFAGRTCSDLPFAAWVPQTVADGLPGLPFTGAIAAVDGKFPFYDVGCLLRLKAGAQVGAWGGASHGPGAPGPATFSVGAFLGGSVSGDFLCLVSGKGSILLQAGVGPGSPLLAGAIDAELELGKCPFCIELDANFSSQINAEGDVNVDY